MFTEKKHLNKETAQWQCDKITRNEKGNKQWSYEQWSWEIWVRKFKTRSQL